MSNLSSKVVVVGARGYSGLELSRLLLRHPRAELAACFATSGFRLSDYLPEESARKVACFAMSATTATATATVTATGTHELLPFIQREKVKFVFLATPAEVSLELAPKVLEAGTHVIDLSGAFRLQAGTADDCARNYKEWYGLDHTRIPLTMNAHYGLVPWADSQGLSLSSGSKLISNPGCFATAVLMAVLPLLKEGIVIPDSVVIDAKSGTTGAGKKAEERLLHSEVDGVCLPYRVGRHQHEPEIRQFVKKYSGVEIEPFFTPHLLNVRRGIIASVYARIDKDLMNQSAEIICARVMAAFKKAYAENPLVEVARLGEGGDVLLNLRRVVGSARTHIAFQVVNDRLYVFSLIDNLLKGAASQAVENFNLMIGAQNSLGLTEMEGVI